jgi:hypothetical protein
MNATIKSLLAAALLVSLPVQAADATAKSCEAKSKAWFKATHGDGKKTLKEGRTVQVSHEAHYNAKRKQCLVRAVSDTPAQGTSPALSNITVREIDSIEKKSLASLLRVGGQMKYCVVEGKKCQTTQEWETASAPLMKE